MFQDRDMNVSTELPQRCEECYKYVASGIHKECKFCQEIEFNEEILCHLNRCIQDPAEFKCHAFKPSLKLVSGARCQESGVHHGKRLKTDHIREFLQSDRIKYKRALALQKLKDDPNGIFVDIKYHFAWNSVHRIPILNKFTNTSDLIYDAFSRCSELIGELVSLLWLAPDHLHLYVETDGERSVEWIVKEVKRVSQQLILKDQSITIDKYELENNIWDEAYFAETIG
jgi:REP element-mobilizing transposase RayT